MRRRQPGNAKQVVNGEGVMGFGGKFCTGNGVEQHEEERRRKANLDCHRQIIVRKSSTCALPCATGIYNPSIRDYAGA